MANNKFNLVIECRETAKGGTYQVLKVDLGYCEKFLTFDRALISEITGISLRDLGTMSKGACFTVGKFEIGE